MQPADPPAQPNTDWTPERKIVGAAAATVVLALVQIIWPDVEIAVGVEGAVAVLVGYFTPNARSEFGPTGV